MFATQMALGWCFPNAVMQYAVPRLEGLTIDVAALARRRDALIGALARAGHAVLPPEGTFYLWASWPAIPPGSGTRSPTGACSSCRARS